MKNIWILNHYAATTLEQKGGRHYWMAKELVKKGYQPTVFCANVIHNAENEIAFKNDYIVKKQEGIKFRLIR